MVSLGVHIPLIEVSKSTQKHPKAPKSTHLHTSKTPQKGPQNPLKTGPKRPKTAETALKWLESAQNKAILDTFGTSEKGLKW
jgi:hypothetical protein